MITQWGTQGVCPVGPPLPVYLAESEEEAQRTAAVLNSGRPAPVEFAITYHVVRVRTWTP